METSSTFGLRPPHGGGQGTTLPSTALDAGEGAVYRRTEGGSGPYAGAPAAATRALPPQGGPIGGTEGSRSRDPSAQAVAFIGVAAPNSTISFRFSRLFSMSRRMRFSKSSRSAATPNTLPGTE